MTVGPAQSDGASHHLHLNQMQARVTGFGVAVARFSAMRRREGENRVAGALGNNSRVKWNYSKIDSRNSILQGKLDHNCVLFVQHPPEKARSQGVRSGSFVACAEVLGNCHLATEGGIPRSSR